METIFTYIGYAQKLLSFILKIFPKTYSFVRESINKSKRIRIGITLEAPETKDLVDYCNKYLKGIGLEGSLLFFDVSGKTDFSNKSSVQDWLKEKTSRTHLVIWVNNKERYRNDKLSLNFTFLNDKKNIFGKILTKEFPSLVQSDKRFNISQEYFKSDLELERKNIYEIGLYITALSVASFESIKSSLPIFERLIEISDRDSFLKKAAIPKLQIIYSLTGGILLSKDKPKALEIFEKSYKLNKRHLPTLSGLAFAYFETGNIPVAEKVSEELLSNFPYEPVALVDAAYFRIRIKKYDNALKFYNRYKRANPPPNVSLEVIDFLTKQIETDQKEPALIFARGYIGHLIDEYKIYKDDLETFIRRTENPEDQIKYKKMRSEAQRIISQ